MADEETPLTDSEQMEDIDPNTRHHLWCALGIVLTLLVIGMIVMTIIMSP